jgi:hypothetical protein
MPEDRRHAAIMFTDIVGYTALMGKDEDGAFDMLKRNHTLHQNLIEKHRGNLGFRPIFWAKSLDVNWLEIFHFSIIILLSNNCVTMKI